MISLTSEIAPNPVQAEVRPRIVSSVVEEHVIGDSNLMRLLMSSQSEQKGLSFYFKQQNLQNQRDYPEDRSNLAVVQRRSDSFFRLDSLSEDRDIIEQAEEEKDEV